MIKDTHGHTVIEAHFGPHAIVKGDDTLKDYYENGVARKSHSDEI
jgi:hypothetical protein